MRGSKVKGEESERTGSLRRRKLESERTGRLRRRKLRRKWRGEKGGGKQ